MVSNSGSNKPKLRDIDVLIARLKSKEAIKNSGAEHTDRGDTEHKKELAIEENYTLKGKQEEEEEEVEQKENVYKHINEYKSDILDGLRTLYEKLSYLSEQDQYWSRDIAVSMEIPLYKEKILNYFKVKIYLFEDRTINNIVNTINANKDMVESIKTGKYDLVDDCIGGGISKEQKEIIEILMKTGNIRKAYADGKQIGYTGNYKDMLKFLACERRNRHSFRRALQLAIWDIELALKNGTDID